jgi:hypothetical protein
VLGSEGKSDTPAKTQVDELRLTLIGSEALKITHPDATGFEEQTFGSRTFTWKSDADARLEIPQKDTRITKILRKYFISIFLQRIDTRVKRKYITDGQ